MGEIAELEAQLHFARLELVLMDALTNKQHDQFAKFLARGFQANGIKPPKSEHDNGRAYYETLLAFTKTLQNPELN